MSAAATTRFVLFVLGIAQDGGLPHLGCAKPCCADARRQGRSLEPACLGVHDRQADRLLLVEATPQIETQVARLHALAWVTPERGRTVDALWITHAHIGHYLGLAQLGREAAAVHGLPLHVTPALGRFFAQNAPWDQLLRLGQLRLETHEEHEVVEVFPGLRIEAIRVPHRNEYADTVALRIAGPTRTVLFCPDVDAWTPGLLERLVQGVDVAYLDGTWYDGREHPGRELAEIPHPRIVETMSLLRDEAAAAPGRFRFVHLNHTNPVLHAAELQAEILARGFCVAEQGERVEL